jgi:hypothetical protein
MVTCVFAAPVDVDRLVMIGGPGGLTVNVAAPLVTLVVTATFDPPNAALESIWPKRAAGQ